jgi:hypothetical protein
MPGHYDRDRRWGQQDRRDEWRDEPQSRDPQQRGNFGRGEEPPADDRGRFMSEGERAPYYGGADFDDYGDRNYGSRYTGRDRSSDYGHERESYRGGRDYGDGRDFGNLRSSNSDDERQGGRDGYGPEGYFRDAGQGYDSRGGGRYQDSLDWRDQDYGEGRGVGQGRGRYADPHDQGHQPRDRWEGSGGSRWDENDARGRREMRDHERDHERERERDERGRFAGDDDRRGGHSGRGGQHGSQEHGDRDGGEHRGWFGDSRGHSHAAKPGWRHR